MGSLTGRAMTLSGDSIVVTFTSAGAMPQEELLINSINLQCDGSGEYTPSKITTASIAVVTNGLALIKALTGSKTQVTVQNVTEGTLLFSGFVVPNSLNQSITGINDVVTIECVDGLGYTQYLNYTQLDVGNGFSVLTISDVVSRITSLVGISLIAVPTTIYLRNPVTSSSTTRFELLTVSEELFFTKTLPDKSVTNDSAAIGMSYEPYAKTCKEVLDMISESFRMTWVQTGSTLYLRDSAGMSSYRYLNSTATIMSKNDMVVTEDSFCGNDCLISQLPRYSRVKITHDDVKEINLLPDPFDQEYLHDIASAYVDYGDDGSNDDAVVRATRLESDLFYFPSFVHTNLIDCTPVAWKEVQGWRNLGVLSFDHNDVFKNGGWQTAIRLRDTTNDSQKHEMMSIQFPYMQATVASGNTYIYPEIEFTIEPRIPSVERIYPYKDKKSSAYLWASLEIGGKYYNIRSNDYSTTLSRFLIIFYSNGDYVLDVDNASVGYTRKGIPVTREGPVCFTIYSRGGQNLGWDNAWIKNLKLNLRRGYAEEAVPVLTEYYGTFTGAGKDLEVSLPIDMYNTLSSARFGTVINGVDYRGSGNHRDSGRIELLFLHQGEYMTMPHYIYQQMNSGDGLSYTIKINDEHNSVGMGDRFTSGLWNGTKVVVGIEKNIIDNIITVTLI